uniref:uncharacterized protein LOC100178751 isoform X1 n=1 Tax=Ciona intestinalis TaxID=7719 RepID=UPI000EF53C90|nr:uncharacterized protein LOC100178751 isoform X1 [Ciona intestinalis]|eukprot:XP_026689525.1 uncharacterized protein LOC100178751 isoform X1 [Ciona intestinalis]
MKVICAELLLFVLSAYAAPVEEEAADLQQADIQLTAEKMEPLTREEVKNLCQLEKYKKLRSCTADPQEKQKLAETKEKYRPMFSEVTDYELDISSTSLWGTFRPVTEQHLSNSSDLNSNSRAKRSTCLPINPCIAGYSDKTFIYGSEYSTGKVYEIVLYPGIGCWRYKLSVVVSKKHNIINNNYFLQNNISTRDLWLECVTIISLYFHLLAAPKKYTIGL